MIHSQVGESETVLSFILAINLIDHVSPYVLLVTLSILMPRRQRWSVNSSTPRVSMAGVD